MSAILALDKGAMRYFFFKRVSPSTESGQGLSLRQTWLHWLFSSSEIPVILNCFSRSSRFMRFKSSRRVHGISPFRTLSMAAGYALCQASVNRSEEHTSELQSRFD